MEYIELKEKLKKTHQMSLKDFTNYVGMHESTATSSWKNKKVPLYIVRVVEGLDAKQQLVICKDKIKRMCEEAQK